jgi:hypothetical protein
LPSSLKTVDSYALYNMLENIYYRGTEEQFKNINFVYDSGDVHYGIHETANKIYNYTN